MEENNILFNLLHVSVLMDHHQALYKNSTAQSPSFTHLETDDGPLGPKHVAY
jgi:hypothetical protein